MSEEKIDISERKINIDYYKPIPWYKADLPEVDCKDIIVRVYAIPFKESFIKEVEKYQGAPRLVESYKTKRQYVIEFSKEVRDIKAAGFAVRVKMKDIEAVIKQIYPNEWFSKIVDRIFKDGTDYIECDGKIAGFGTNEIIFDYSQNKEGVGKYKVPNSQEKIEWIISNNKEERVTRIVDKISSFRFKYSNLVFGDINAGDISITTLQISNLFWTKNKKYDIKIAE